MVPTVRESQGKIRKSESQGIFAFQSQGKLRRSEKVRDSKVPGCKS